MKFRLFCILMLCSSVSNVAIQAQDKLYPNEFPLKDVKLLDGPFKQARELNIQTLLKYDVDRLLAGYRKEAGLKEKAKSFSNWDGLDGHVGGHYLTALALNYAATGNAECKKRLDYMIAELKDCQLANGQKYPDWGMGYVGAVPNGAALWPVIKGGDISPIWKWWVPWYNVHKMYAGLRDAWLYAGNEEAKNIFIRFCDWGINITAGLTDAQMESMLGNEHGGMNEIYADVYKITGDQKYMTAAKRFSHKMLLDAMAADNDNLDNKHANTQVPKVVGFQRIAELTNDKAYAEASRFFWKTVTETHSLAFGGNSRREFFPSAEACTDFVNDVEGPETCNSYNMLKLTEDLFRVNPLAQYADYYERTMFNHILSSQHPEHGGYVYFTPARPRHFRVYSSPNQAMWCCVGSGMENHGKYNQFIYTHSENALYLNLFVASELNWRTKKVKIKQETTFPNEEQTKLKITEGSAQFQLMVRYPSWVQAGALKIKVNGKLQSVDSKPGSYVAVNRRWKTGDEVLIELPMQNKVEQMPNVPNYVAIMHGPILLAAKSGAEELKGLVADDSRWGHIAGGQKLAVDKAPIIIEDDIANIAANIKPMKGKPLTFTLDGLNIINPIKTELQPFSQIHDSRYMMYWMALTNSQYKSYIDSLSTLEKAKLELQKRTVDFVAPGEQQPEADHFIQKENSNTGNKFNEFWRDARNGGFFSYKLTTNSETNLSLMVRYCGAEQGGRKFDIYIDDEKLVTEDNTDRWKQAKFQEVVYEIPNALIKDKQNVRLKFQSTAGNTAGSVFYIRLLRK
jgi:uncharacterized protein